MANANCPYCGWSGDEFLPTVRKDGTTVLNARCPACLSRRRHRGIYSWLIQNIDRNAVHKILHVSPEVCLKKFFRSFSNSTIVSIDLKKGVADQVQDIQKLSFPDASFDLAICSYVLDQVADDQAAISELFRVLEPSGMLVLLVPLNGNETTEETTGNSLRIYGETSLSGQLVSAGFQVRFLQPNILFSKDALRYNGLCHKQGFFVCTKPSAT